MIGNKLNNDSIIEQSQDRLVEYEHKLKQKDEIIDKVHTQNVQLSKKLDEIWTEKSILEEKYESMESFRQSAEKENNNILFLKQKLDHLQQELDSVIKIKNCKEQECRQYISEISKKDNLIIQKNNKIQEICLQMEQTEQMYKGQMEDILAENEELKNNCIQFEEELHEYKEKLEALQGDLEDVKTKTINKENEILNYSKMYEEQSQDQLSALKMKYDEVQNNLIKELNNTKDTEKKEKMINRDMQKALNELKHQNEELQIQLASIKEANSKQKSMINIISSPRAEEKASNSQKIAELQDRINALLENEQSQDETISKLKEKLIKLREDRNNEREEYKREKNDLNQKLDKLLTLTQKDRVDMNLTKIDSDKFVRQIEELKVSEAKLKEQLKKMSKDNANYLKELHDSQKKCEEFNEKAFVLKDKIEILESKNEELEKKYQKAVMVVEKLEAENIDQKQEIDDLRQFKQQNKLQESKISSEYDMILKEYKDQIKRLQQELSRQDERDCGQMSYMQCANSRKNETLERSMNEGDLREAMVPEHDENFNQDPNSVLYSASVNNTNMRRSMPSGQDREENDHYQEYFYQWAQSLNIN